MMTENFLRKIIITVLIFGSLFFAKDVLAEVKMYRGVGESQMSEIETAEVVKIRAREKAIQNATKQAGVYLKTYSRSVNSELTEEEISAITSTKYKTVGEPSYKRIIRQMTDVTTAIVWQATLNVNVDDEEIRNWLNLDASEKATLIKLTKDNLENLNENDKKVEDLRRQYLNATTEAERDRIKAELLEVDKIFLAVQKFEEGNNFHDKYNYQKAIESYNTAINLNPNYAAAYYKRGKIYFYDFNEDERAIADFSKAIQIQPNYDDAYYERGNAYKNSDDYEKAILDFDKAIKLTPKFAAAYSSRAFTYYLLKDYNRAIEDYSRAIEIQPNRKNNYKRRGECYKKLGELEKAQADFAQYEFWNNR